MTQAVQRGDQRYAAGDTDQPGGSSRPSITALYQAHYLAVFALARGVTLDDRMAEDVTQVAFRKARHKHRRRPPDLPDQAWVCALAARLAIGRMRRRAVRQLPAWPFRLLERWRRGDSSEVEDPEVVLDRLPARWRAGLVLRFVHGYSWSDIPPIVGVRSEQRLGAVTGMSCPVGLPERAETAWIGPSPLPELSRWLRTPSELERQMSTLRWVTGAVVLALAVAVVLIRLAVIVGPLLAHLRRGL